MKRNVLYRNFLLILFNLMCLLFIVGLVHASEGGDPCLQTDALKIKTTYPLDRNHIAGYANTHNGQGVIFLHDISQQSSKVIRKIQGGDLSVRFIESCSPKFICWHEVNLDKIQDILFDIHKGTTSELASLLGLADKQSFQTEQVLDHALTIESSGHILATRSYVVGKSLTDRSEVRQKYVYYDLNVGTPLTDLDLGQVEVLPQVARRLTIDQQDAVLVSEDMLSGVPKRQLKLYSLEPFRQLTAIPLDVFVWSIEKSPETPGIILVSMSPQKVIFSDVFINRNNGAYVLSIASTESVSIDKERVLSCRAWHDYRFLLTREPRGLWILNKGQTTLDQKDARFISAISGFSLNSCHGVLTAWHDDTIDFYNLNNRGIQKLSCINLSTIIWDSGK